MTGGAGPRGHARVGERCRPPSSGSMTTIAGGGRIRPAFMASRNTSGGPSVTGCARSWSYSGMVKRCRPPGCGPVAAVA